MVVAAPLRVNFFDTDAMGVVHHANYIRWFERGRVEFLRALGLTLGALMDAGYVFPIIEVQAKYHAPAHFDDELVILTRPLALTKAKMAFTYEVRRKGDDALLVTGETVNVFTDRQTGKIRRLEPEFYAKLQAANV